MSAQASAIDFDADAAGFNEKTERDSGLVLTRTSATTTTVAGKYRLERLIGEGGMGAVWRAINIHLEMPVAIKLLRPGRRSLEVEERLRIEARAVAKLVHPGIVRVFDTGESDAGEPFIVMELLSGESLGQALERGPLSPIDAVQLLLPIAEALSLAHSRGVVHRDLKPDNIFVAVEGGLVQPKLLDFGIAKVISTAPASSIKLTQAGTLLGSPEYMSPEQASGHPDVDDRSDVWSFCVVLYEALSGRPPFSASDCQALLRSVVRDTPLPLDVCAGVDPRLSELVQRGLEKDREKRHSSIFELGQALASWLLEQGVQDDATGSSLAAKWYGHGHQLDNLISRKLPLTPRARQEQVTLVSLVRPEVRLGSDETMPAIELPARAARSWIPMIVISLAALGGIGLALTFGKAPALPVTSTASPAAPRQAAIASAPPPRFVATSQTAAGTQLEYAPTAAVRVGASVPSSLQGLPDAAKQVRFSVFARPAKMTVVQTVERDPTRDLLDPYPSSSDTRD